LETMRLAYHDLLNAYPDLEGRLADFPLRVFSGREHPVADTRGVFFCYTLPAKNLATDQWDGEAGFTRWYLYDPETESILEDAEQINAIIQSDPETPRRCKMTLESLAAIRKKVERHITNTYLKSVQAPAGVKPVIKAWMELN